jgi:hypothetical protein
MRVNAKLVQDADNLAKELRIPFRDSLDIVMRAFLNRDTPTQLAIERTLRGERPSVMVKGDR